MNILLDMHNVNVNNILFAETKPNMMFDGVFTKILYCDEFFTMYGIYINVPITNSSSTVKPSINAQIFNSLVKLEDSILNAYAKSRPIQHRIVTHRLSELLKAKFSTSSATANTENANYLKISGIWENNKTNEVGLSFKI
jgi:hypothetical protein